MLHEITYVGNTAVYIPQLIVNYKMKNEHAKQESSFLHRSSKRSIVLNDMVKMVNYETVLNKVNFSAFSGQM